ncbi:MAG: glycosyl transferase family 1 [Bacteroidetes bacterium]|nr:MAG: glycosyl transferase family 1 [Bacteroidota bacterium]
MNNIIIGPAYPLRGGIANFNAALCNAFLKKNIDSKIISFSLQYPKILFPGKTQLDNGNAPENIEISSDINSINPFNWFKLAKKIVKLNPDYIIVDFWMPFMAPALGTIIRRIKRKKNIKIIAITHNVVAHESKFYDKILTKYFIKSCDGFVAMSKSVLEDIKQFTTNQHLKFIPHPIYDIFGEKVSKDQALDFLKLKKEDKHILFFGLIRKYKGLDLLLKAMGTDKIKKLNIKLIVAGEFYDYKLKYEKIIDELKIRDNVILKDTYILNQDVKYYFSVADIVAQPYKTASQSGVTQIAYHFERPMLVTDVGGLSEIVPDNKVGYVTQTTPESIANAIFDFYENNKEAEFVENVKIEKNRFSWNAMVDGICDLEKEIN